MNTLIDNSNANTRPLGYVECVHYILNSYVNILRNVIVAIEIEKRVSNDFIISFLKSAHKHFIALRLKTQEIEKTAVFVASVDYLSIPIKIINASSDDKCHLITEIEHEMNNPINSNNFMWRAKILNLPNSNLLILTFHHSIFDGRSIIKLLKHLESIDEKTIQEESSPVFTAIEENIKLSAPITQIPSSNEDEILTSRWPINQDCEIKYQKSKFIIIDINYIKADTLKKFCRNNNLSINQLLNALTIKAISMIFSENESIAIHTPIDLTKYSDKAHHHKELGCFIAVIRIIVKNYKDKNLLELAGIYTEEFKKSLSRLTVENNFNFNNLKDILINKFKKRTKYFSGGIAVSNIGEMSLKTDKQKPIIKDIYFSTSLFGGLGIFILSALTYSNELKLTLSYTFPLLSEDFISSFITAFKTALQEVK